MSLSLSFFLFFLLHASMIAITDQRPPASPPPSRAGKPGKSSPGTSTAGVSRPHSPPVAEKRIGSLVNINIQARFRGNQSSISPASCTFVLPMPRGAKSNQCLLRSSPEIFRSAAAPNSCFCAFSDKPKII